MTSRRRVTSGEWRALVLGTALVAASSRGQEIDLAGGLDVDKELKGLFAPANDLELLRLSHYTEVYRWAGVAPARPDADQDVSSCAWKAGEPSLTPARTLTSPVGRGEASTVVYVPEARDYRVWLGYLADPRQTHPVTLSLSGSNQAKHVYGNVRPNSSPGGEMEKALPVRFEDDVGRMKASTERVMLWEFADMRLDAGTTRLALESADQAAQVDGVLITGSRAFVPSKSAVKDEGNLYRTWCRVRVSKAANGTKTFSVPRPGLTYHWFRYPRGKDAEVWYWSLGTKDDRGFAGEDGKASMPVGAWTRWVEVTEDVMSGPWARGGGPWATASFKFPGVAEGRCEVQLAWYPHEGGVLKTVAPGIAEGRALCMIPLQPLCQAAVSGTNCPAGVWGMRDPAALARFESSADVHRRHLDWARAAVAMLGPAATNPVPRLIDVFAGCGAAPADRPAAVHMLAKLGINDVLVSDPAVEKEMGREQTVLISAADSEYLCGTHDPLDAVAERNFEATLRKRGADALKGRESNPPQVRLLMGDEIGSEGGGSTINRLETCRKAFHDYLRVRLKERGADAGYYGVADVDELPYLDTPPERPGLHERRLFYDCQRFKFVLTAMYYGQLTRAAERVFPRVHTYCNFSPHPPMFGQHMNGSDWFALTRGGGANMAWGEDWAGQNGGWGFTGFDVVSYYAAWVECAARTRGGLPAGFYAVGSMGGSDRKLFSLVPRGIWWINTYSYGPAYALADQSNAWSENRNVYTQIARATHALGPADETIVRGKREPRRVAVLYNRTHELWNGGAGGVQTDRLLEFTALSHAHIPAEIIIEEDCTDTRLAGYRVIYVQGYSIEAMALAALRRWVAAGGVLVGVAGTAMRDESDTPTAAAEALFGARQRLAGESRANGKVAWHPQSLPDHQPIDMLTLRETGLTPAMTADVIGVKAELTPTTGQAAGTYGNGACAAVIHTLGQGRTLLLGVQPGTLYKGTARGGSRYMQERRPLVTKPAEATLGRMRVEYSEPQTEVWLFEREGQVAVTLNNFAFFLEPKDRTATLTVQTDLPVKAAVSTLRGSLSWQREGDRIRVDVPAPETVDVVILR